MNRLENIYKKILENEGKIFMPGGNGCVAGNIDCPQCPLNSIRSKLMVETKNYYNCFMEKDRIVIVETLKQTIRKIRLEKLLS